MKRLSLPRGVCIPFVDDFLADQFGDSVLSVDLSCARQFVSASEAFDSIVYFVASSQVVFGAELACFGDLEVAVGAD